MAFVVADRVQETTATTGTTTTLNLAGASPACQSFVSGVGSGNTCNVCVLSGDNTSWEVINNALVTAGTPNTLTISAANVTSGSSGAGVLVSLTGVSTVYVTAPAASLNNIGVTPPARPSVGQLWWDSVGGQLYIYYNDGTSSQWVAASSLTTGQSTPPIVAPPVAASWTQQNFGGSTTLTNVANGLLLQDLTGTAGVRAITMAAPAAPYTIDINFSGFGYFNTGQFPGYFLGWSDGTKYQFMNFGLSVASGGTTGQFGIQTYSNINTFVANVVQYLGPSILQNGWGRIADNGTTITASMSSDGINYSILYTVAKASGYLGSSGYSNVMIGLNSAAGPSIQMALRSWWVH